ncbi:MAG: UDP-2,3-diacylglucosamine diphosphatase LpxI [Alphaproteobacteria bacterium]
MLALIAGGGKLPSQVIAAAQELNKPFLIIAFTGQTDPELVAGHPHYWTHLGAVGDIVTHLHANAVKEIVMAGNIKRPAFSEMRLDGMGVRWLGRIGWRAFGDDGVLSSITNLLEEEGFAVVAAAALLGEGLLSPSGVLGAHHPSDADRQDIARGIEVIKALGTVDVGQATVIQQGLVLGVEAIEGTEKLLERCGTLRRAGPGGVLVKIAKPGQSHRVDLPTIGVDTITQASKSQLVGIALQAGATQIIDRENVIALADKLGLFVVGMDV